MDKREFDELLNEDLSTEYQSIVQYTQHIATVMALSKQFLRGSDGTGDLPIESPEFYRGVGLPAAPMRACSPGSAVTGLPGRRRLRAGRTPAVGAVNRVAVVIPAHDEAALIVRCLRSVFRAARRCPLDVDVVVAADSCRAATAAVAASMGVRVIEIGAGNVGRARTAGCAAALHRGQDGLWLAHTDADSAVPADWLVRQLRYAARGVDLVAGVVRVDQWRDWPSGLRVGYEAVYRGAQHEGHHHAHGANLGTSAAAYLSLGGFPPLPVGEDPALIADAERAGLAVAYALDRTVTTSGRRHGRISGGGFHGFLARLADKSSYVDC